MNKTQKKHKKKEKENREHLVFHDGSIKCQKLNSKSLFSFIQTYFTMNAIEPWEALSANDIVLTHWMEQEYETDDDEHEQMDIVHPINQWKPQQPHVIPFLRNRVIHIQRISNGGVVSGPLVKFGCDRNGYHYIIILDQAHNPMHIGTTIGTTLVQSVYIDHTPTTRLNLRNVCNELLLSRLNSDVVYEISSYLRTDYLYL